MDGILIMVAILAMVYLVSIVWYAEADNHTEKTSSSKETNQGKNTMEPHTIQINLIRIDLINMIRGCDVPYELMGEFSKLGLGYYTGGLDDRWTWYSYDSEGWQKVTMEKLLAIYQNLRQYQMRFHKCDESIMC